ncbi:MAG: GntR family transcriptional regulator [Fusobacteriaceae bacterium]|jgi:DNA-binding GntR family transcriptional regulator|nr:GntR family transcriptional regulator [Fusobacteriaceae bacterium]
MMDYINKKMKSEKVDTGIVMIDDFKYRNREDMVYEALKKNILELVLKPGQVVSEAEVCQMFGVSRTPVRNSLRILAEKGYVDIIPYRGIYIKLLSLKNIKQMIYMRYAVEAMVLEDFINNDNKIVLEDINYMIRKQEALIVTKNFKPEQFYRVDVQIHGLWFEAENRSKLWEMFQFDHLHYTRFKMLDFITETDFTRIIKEHKNIVNLIEKKDIKKLRHTLKDHLYYSMKRMRHAIDVDYRDYFEEESDEGKFDI